MAAIVGWFLLAGVVLWLGVVVWLSAKGGLRGTREYWRTFWPVQVFGWLGLVGLPLLVAYLGAHGGLTVGGVVFAAAAWIAFGALVAWVRRAT